MKHLKTKIKNRLSGGELKFVNRESSILFDGGFTNSNKDLS